MFKSLVRECLSKELICKSKVSKFSNPKIICKSQNGKALRRTPRKLQNSIENFHEVLSRTDNCYLFELYQKFEALKSFACMQTGDKLQNLKKFQFLTKKLQITLESLTVRWIKHICTKTHL